jgi:hypothetical protein
MPRRRVIVITAPRWSWLAILASLACGAAAQAAPAQPIWPEKWREHQREKAAPVTPPEAQLWAEFGGEAAEKAIYESPVGRFSATAYRLKDATAALAWYEYLRPETAVPARGAATVSTMPGAQFAAHQNYVLVFEGWRPLEAEMAALYKRLPQMRGGGGLPKLIGYLPEKDRRRNSERYILGLHSLELFAPAVPGAVAGFEDGAEAQAARYQTPGGEMPLVIFEYPTPQVAQRYEAEFGKLAGWQVKRTGPLVAVVPAEAGHAVDAAAAKALLDPIEWNLEFTWYESAKRHMPVNVGAMLVGAIELTGAVLAAVFFGGVFFAVIGVWIRRRGLKDGEEPGLTVLRLNG